MKAMSLNQSHSSSIPATPLRQLAAALTRTDDALAPLVLRLALAVVIFPHGAQKLFGWFGGYGFEGTMQFLTGTIGAPYIFALAAILAEVIGPIALVAGIGSRVAALAIGANMVVAALTFHLPNGFFMNWSGQQAGEGVEFFILAAAMTAALVVAGSGRLSIDRLLTGNQR